MPAPKSYIIGTPDPLAGFTRGLKFGAGIQQIEAATEAAKQKAKQAEILAQREQSLQSYIDKIQAGTATAADYQNASILANKDQAENIRKAYEARSAEENQATLTESGKIVSAFKSGVPSLGIQMMQDRSLALSNAGKVNEAAFMENLIEIAKESPNQVGDFLASQMTLIPGGSDVLDGVLKTTKERREVAQEGRLAETHILEIKQKTAELGKTNAETNKLISETQKNVATANKTNNEAASVALDAAKKQLELEQVNAGKVDLDKDARKLINDSVLSAINSRSLANQYDTLANQITTELSAGKVAQAEELFKKVWGSEDQVSRLRQEYKRLRNSQVLQSLPPGVASDKDIEIAMGAFPADTASPEVIASFLRGMAKLNRYDADVSSLTSEWVNNVGSLAPAPRDMTIDGRDISAGSSFGDTVQNMIESVSPLDVPVVEVDETVVETPAPAPAPATGQPTTVTVGAREYIYNPDGSITTAGGQVVQPGGALAKRITRQIADSIIGGAE